MNKNLITLLHNRGVSEKIVFKIANLFGNLIYKITINNLKTVPMLNIDFSIKPDITGEIRIINDKDFYISFYSEKTINNSKIRAVISDKNLSFAILNEKGLFNIKGRVDKKNLPIYFYNRSITELFVEKSNQKKHSNNNLGITIDTDHEMLNHINYYSEIMGITPKIGNFYLENEISLIPYLLSEDWAQKQFTEKKR